jgi:hypothetical protein
MTQDEYKVIAAPAQGRKAKGVKTTADRFALTMSDVLNEMAQEGWEYVRAETLPCEERRGLTGTQTTFQNVLIFRRRPVEVSVPAPVSDDVPEANPTPVTADAAPEALVLAKHEDADPVSTALGDTLRAMRGKDDEADAPARRLGPAREDSV